MLNETQLTEFARRIRNRFDRRTDTDGLMVSGGWFPYDVDVVLADVVAGNTDAADVVQVDLRVRDLNEGYAGSLIQFALEDDMLVVTCRLPYGVTTPALSVDSRTGRIMWCGQARDLPEGFALEDGVRELRELGRTVERLDDGVRFRLTVYEQDDEYDDDYDDCDCY